LCALFFLLPKSPSGGNVILALGMAGGGLAGYTGVRAAKNGAEWKWLFQFIPLLLWLGAAAWNGPVPRLTGHLVFWAATWNGVALLALLGPRAVAWREVKELSLLLAEKIRLPSRWR
ncbi:MAG: hypothetical protein LBN38_06705, partial [Verrucomicrobiota bacterium]|nr:hypothetical protein [Verrucomicrobiota bacterium]